MWNIVIFLSLCLQEIWKYEILKCNNIYYRLHILEYSLPLKVHIASSKKDLEYVLIFKIYRFLSQR